ncbi:MAG: OsmC family protein [Gemmataceae bacterium]|nr:OsmC family protein [Gemmataceae bacterium]MDW8267022.1 OsmC family protein [Gemmataceae bacterium]
MTADELRTCQAPLKERYRTEPAAARLTLQAHGTLDATPLTCKVETARAVVEAGLHPATGGDGQTVCSGNMLLEALVACAGVTLRAVATALGINIRQGRVTAEGDLDFRGTLGVSKEVPVGFQAIRVRFDLDADATPEQLATLMKLTERYCVVYQTLRHPGQLSLAVALTGNDKHEGRLGSNPSAVEEGSP